MAESIINRVGRIISGSANALIDAVENASPSLVMEQAIREIDQAIDDVRLELGKVIVSKHLASKRLSEKNSRHEEFSDKIKIAIDQDRDDLAEAAIAVQLDIEAQIPILENTIAQSAEREVELESYINALQAKKREMKNELNSFLQSQKEKNISALSKDNNFAFNENSVGRAVDKATSAFDRILEKKTGISDITSNNKDLVKLQQLENLALDNRIKERMAAIKSQKDKDSA